MEIELGYEVPINCLEEFDNCQDFLFILPHQLHIDEYRNYILNSNKLKYLDNSAYELSVSIDRDELIEWCRLIKPQCMVIPDKMHERHEENMISSKEFVEYFKTKGIENVELMKVIHGDDPDEYKQNIIESIECFSYLGISRDRSAKLGSTLSAVMFIDNECVKQGKQISLHLLGCTSPRELMELENYTPRNILKISLDTGLPFNFAREGQVLQSYKFNRISGKDIDIDLQEDKIELAKLNCSNFRNKVWKSSE